MTTTSRRGVGRGSRPRTGVTSTSRVTGGASFGSGCPVTGSAVASVADLGGLLHRDQYAGVGSGGTPSSGEARGGPSRAGGPGSRPFLTSMHGGDARQPEHVALEASAVVWRRHHAQLSVDRVPRGVACQGSGPLTGPQPCPTSRGCLIVKIHDRPCRTAARSGSGWRQPRVAAATRSDGVAHPRAAAARSGWAAPARGSGRRYVR